MSEDKVSAVVIDNGSGECKAGFAGDESPCSAFPSIIGRPIGINKLELCDHYVGDEAQRRRGLLDTNHPIVRGAVTNWDDMESIWQYILQTELYEKYDSEPRPDQRPILVTTTPLNPKEDREKLTEIMFEKFEVPALYVCPAAVLSLYSSGRTTGIVTDSGHGVSQTLAVYEGYPIPESISQVNLSGCDIDHHLKMTLIKKRGYSFAHSIETEIIHAIKENLCYVALDYDKETQTACENKSLQRCYRLPDGEMITLNSERFQCAEGFFQPNIIGTNATDTDARFGIHEIIVNSVKKCDDSMHKDLLANIVLSGGSTKFPGFTDRMVKELKPLLPPSVAFKVINPQERHQSWIGGSVLASLSTFEKMWIRQHEYDESGPSIVHRKCIGFL